MWVPCFACPDCGVPLASEPDSKLACVRCGSVFERRNGVWRFLSAERQLAAEPFTRQYRFVRQREGVCVGCEADYRALPNVTSTDPRSAQWRVRRESYDRLLGLAHFSNDCPIRVLDLGAGNAWLSSRLALAGHSVVAVDRLDDDADGLGVTQIYSTPLVAVQADFDALPFAPRQFDLVVFNASLHYAPDMSATLDRAHAMLRPEAALVVMDSPLFDSESDGRAMVDEMDRRFQRDYGLRDIVRPGRGYLTFSALSASSARLGMRAQFYPSPGPVSWRFRRRYSAWKLGRRPAAFGIWVATQNVRAEEPPVNRK